MPSLVVSYSHSVTTLTGLSPRSTVLWVFIDGPLRTGVEHYLIGRPSTWSSEDST